MGKMTEPVSAQDYTLEYLRAYFELLGDEDEGMAHWLVLMDLSNDHLMSLCLLRGDVAFRQLESFPEAYHWYARACQYASCHSSQALDEAIQCIYHHLERMQQRAQRREAKEFCTALLDVWADSELREQKPKFVDDLQRLATENAL